MKNANFIFCLFTYIILASLTSCQNEPELATITTSPVGSIADNSAVSGGYISDDGGADVTSRGVVWNTSPNPTTANNSTNDGNGPGNFTSNLSGLTANTPYYVRAYATNSAGTAYGNQQSFNTTGIISNPGAGVTYNGHTYSSVVLGNGQEWMSENLRTANYRNGDPIPTGLDQATWQTTTSGAYAIYNNNNANEAIYGKLYNGYAVADPRQVCPTGWHVPTYVEWLTLTGYLGGNEVAGGKMKTSGLQYWNSPNVDANNESGFSGLPGGYRTNGGVFNDVGNTGDWWSSSQSGTSGAWNCYLNCVGGNATQVQFNKRFGFSVRCLKD
jgi:uncharacterized protein (TIGR02145 family)